MVSRLGLGLETRSKSQDRVLVSRPSLGVVCMVSVLVSRLGLGLEDKSWYLAPVLVSGRVQVSRLGHGLKPLNVELHGLSRTSQYMFVGKGLTSLDLTLINITFT